MMKEITFFSVVLFFFLVQAASLLSQPLPTPAGGRSASAQRIESSKSSLLANVKSENIGPSIFNGRVADLEVNPSDPTEFYVAYASGGLWHTSNNGTTFTPLFQQESVMTIGDIAVDWKTGIIFLGSGEQNSSRSSYAGNGVYKSTDKGQTWTHLGLDETHHISKVLIHPTNHDIVWVAALGHLYSSNPERGVFMSRDGGKTWNHSLYVNDGTGASDLAVNPANPEVLYAATWERSRTAWNFVGAGSGSGIHKSTDGGSTWSLVSGPASGFLNGDKTGRIGLDVCVHDGKEYIYAVVDNNNNGPVHPSRMMEANPLKEKFRTMTAENFLALLDEDIAAYIKSQGFPDKYSPKNIKKRIREGSLKVADLATYNDDANSALFNSTIIGAEVYRSDNGGSQWNKTHSQMLYDVYFTYGYYFGQIRVHPKNPDHVYIFGVPMLSSKDGGKSWKSLDAENVHSDHHALWINPERSGHMINGNDGGVNITYDDGASWIKCTQPEVGQFYYVNVDNNEPYQVYGGTQDNGVWMGSHQYKNTTRWQSTGEYPYKMLMGGDGMQVQIDNRDNATIYTGFQFGNYFRINRQKRDRSFITPKHELGQKPYRWNWQTPILLSPHNQDILYMGSERLHRSMNQGKDFTEISPDLTRGGREGNVPFGTLTTIDESKLKFGLIYAGSDDGLVHVSRDGGYSWKRISDELPQHLWVSRVQASAFEEGRVYVALNGYRNDHFLPYVYVSDDYGDTWTLITKGLLNEPVNVIKEDATDPDILYVGMDHGVYVSVDRGKQFMLFNVEMPRVPVHDLVIQRKSGHLIIGTHGRSIYKADINALHDLKSAMSSQLYLYALPAIKHSKSWGRIADFYTESKPLLIDINIFTQEGGEATLEVISKEGLVLKKSSLELQKGLATYAFDLRVDPGAEAAYLKWAEKLPWAVKNGPLKKGGDNFWYLTPAVYELRLSKGALKTKGIFEIKE